MGNRAMVEMASWNSPELRPALEYRLTDNQHLLRFLHEYRDELVSTELDQNYQYFVNALIEDQKGLAFVGSHLGALDMAENLELDGFLEHKPNLKSEVTQALGNNLRLDSSKRVVNRVLYYSLMEKYAGN
jgi:hypothetical protein